MSDRAPLLAAAPLLHLLALAGSPLAALLGAVSPALAQAPTVPTDIQQPGTQPFEASLESPNKCDNCHAGYDAAVEPVRNWEGSMMAHASRDPLFWATVAVAEQDFDGAGDLCLRCHIGEGWLDGHSTPTDGSTMLDSEASGVSCDLCHHLTNPDASEHLGVQNPPFVANDGGSPAQGYYGSGMYVLWGVQNERMGPYANAASPHTSHQSAFHRSPDLCGTCHDVSNPAVGDLAPGNGAQTPLPTGSFSGTPGAIVDLKAAFNNFPFQYGIVERTYSEHRAGLLTQTLVSDYGNLPTRLQRGAVARAQQAAVQATGPSGNYEDGTPRSFTCQTCHMPPVQGKGCNRPNAPVRADLPLHDQTGGNTWVPDAMLYMDGNNDLLLGGNLSAREKTALAVGKTRAQQNLTMAAALDLSGNLLEVVNLTGHKLLTGYPEGRRMWLRVEWFDDQGAPLRVDGEYGTLSVTLEGSPLQVQSLLDLQDPYLQLWETQPGMSQAWAQALLQLGYDPALPLEYDRLDGSVLHTLGGLAAQPAGTAWPTFHFVLNDAIVSDNRIPTYGMGYDDALARNILPVPETQYGDPGPGGVYDYWDEVRLQPPPGAHTATIELLYQTTSWEFVQFLVLANDGQNAFLGSTGDDLLDAWLNTGMSAPVVMASTTWNDTCTGSLASYCTAGTTANGCRALISASGRPSASAGTGFDVRVDGVEGSKQGILFFGTTGPAAKTWGSGTSFLCVASPVKRTGVQSSGGNSGACDGTLTLDFNAWLAANPAKAPAPGTTVYMQAWFRDPPSPRTTSLSDALSFELCP